MKSSLSRSKLLKQFMPAKVIQSQLHRRVYVQFAEKLGLVYFGYVNQRNDEHRLIRGLTVSSTHRDTHYSVGTFQGYDISLVERSDTLQFPGKAPRSQQWIIATIDLHHNVDLPHLFVGLKSHSETFYSQLFTKFPYMQPVALRAEDGYNVPFLERYTLYTHHLQALSASRLFNAAIANPTAEHFQGLTVELSENCLYIYAEHQRPTGALLEKMVTYGLWLARYIDNEQ